MSYLALYRKYRPSSFDEIAGQQAVVTALRNQVRYGQVGHAYLFCGSRGTGKTSVARVFAKAVNCLNPRDGSPCNECELCREAQSGFNLIEIDAASNNGVDSIRELRDEVVYTPVKGRYKVYIIDEAHMLSAQAFNALLKTLEEPPEHVIFILATTEPHKIMPTILSRCQRYDFKRLSVEEMTERLRYVAAQENIAAEEEAITCIASSSDGGMRDALSLLDQCHAYYINETITLPRVLEVLGAVDNEILGRMTEALSKGDAAGLLQGVEEIYRQGRDPQQFVTAWCGYLRGVLIYRVLGKEAEGYLTESPGVRRLMAEQARELSQEELTFYIQEFSRLSNQLKFALQKRIILETGLLSLSRGLGSGTEESGLAARLAQVEKRLEELSHGGAAETVRRPAAASGEQAPSPRTERPAPTAEASRRTPETAASGDGNVPADWPEIRKRIIKEKQPLYILNFMQLTAGAAPDELVLRTDKEIYRKQLEADGQEKLRFVEEKIREQTGRPYRLSTGASAGTAPSMEELLSGIKSDIQWK